MKRKRSLTLAAVAVCISATSAQGQLLGPPTQRDVEQGAEMLNELQRNIAARGIDFRIVEARSSVRDFLRVEGLEEKIGKIGRMKSIADILDEFPTGLRASAPSLPSTPGSAPAATAG